MYLQASLTGVTRIKKSLLKLVISVFGNVFPSGAGNIYGVEAHERFLLFGTLRIQRTRSQY